jgi:hypothetical protein
MIEAALQYAGRGWHVFPCRDKRPWQTKHGFYDATTDPEIIARWNWPEIGLRLGEPSGLSCLDIDVHQDRNGFEVLTKLGVAPASDLAASTPSGGQHLFYKYIPSGKFDLAPGLEWKSDGSYVVLPPLEGRAWLSEAEASEAPEWLRVVVGLRGARSQSLLHHGAGLDDGSHETHALGGLARDGLGGREELAPGSCLSSTNNLSAADPLPFEPTHNLRARSMGIIRWLERAERGTRNDWLYRASCVFAEMIGEGKIKPNVAVHLLLGACRVNGLLQEDGEAACRDTIASAFRRVEERKLTA